MSPELQQTLQQLAHAAEWINRFTTPFFDQKKISDEKNNTGFLQQLESFKAHIDQRDALYPGGHTANVEIAIYHRMLDQAFTLAFDKNQPAAGRYIADQARVIIFDDILVPYNRLLGRSKKNDSLRGYGDLAMSRFAGWLDTSANLSDTQRTAVLAVFQELLTILEDNRQGAQSVWKDSALVWLPLQYGLTPQQYGTRDQLNGILEQLAEKPFSHANEVFYVIDELFQPEVARMVFEAEDYHVLWVHDIRGMNAAGQPDSISFPQSVNAYLAALTKNVQEYDVKGKLPAHMIFIDQYFYELTEGKYWLELLQTPLHHRMKLPKGYEDWATQIQEAQEALRQAVAASERLQAEAENYGKDWIIDRVKVHVSVTNRADASFRTGQIIPSIPVIPDDMMRDHRKLSFYDITELDPGKGEALYSGMGIGEQYAGPTWEDRAMLVRGPAFLSLKDEARALLLQQGFTEDEIPLPLRKLDKPANYDQMVEDLQRQGWTASVMDLHNQTGFRPKQINLMKATLYSLMPPGSTMIIPDGFWNAPFWGGMIVGSALRGCQVLTIAPSPENSTFTDAAPLQSRTQELLARQVMIQQTLHSELDAVGGMLKTGVYNRHSFLGDIVPTFEEMFAGFRASPFLQEIFPFQPEVYSVLETIAEEAKATGFTPDYYNEDVEPRKPKLHIKINYFMSEEIRDLMALPGWGRIFRDYLHYREKLIAEDIQDVDVKDVPKQLREDLHQVLHSFWESLSEEERQRLMAYMTIGSQNHNYRSMILDGEVVCLIAGAKSLVALLDMFALSGMTTWVDDLDALEQLLPAYTGWNKWLSRFIMKTL